MGRCLETRWAKAILVRSVRHRQANRHIHAPASTASASPAVECGAAAAAGEAAQGQRSLGWRRVHGPLFLSLGVVMQGNQASVTALRRRVHGHVRTPCRWSRGAHARIQVNSTLILLRRLTVAFFSDGRRAWLLLQSMLMISPILFAEPEGTR